jgi:N6-L-threonylcarbamoyladenine synthase
MAEPHIVLGIETSCDETSAAVIVDTDVASNIVSSQEIHNQFGGVVPELASRAHIRLITHVVEQALDKAKIKKEQLTGIAITHGPGLVGALLVGLNFGKGMAQALHIPFVGINHIEGHIYGNFLTNPEISFPHLCLVVSGGHSQLVLMKNHLEYEIIGKTRDDAVGEAFDKGAKILGLEYPGGPLVDKYAKDGDDSFYAFPRAYLKGENLDFSYSGLKTALLVYSKKQSPEYIAQHMNDICASYQKAAIEVLVQKTKQAAERYKIASIGIVGGVAANSLLRRWMKQVCHDAGWSCFIPDFQYCTDNAAMIARAGLERLKRNIVSQLNLNAYPALKLNETLN